MDEVVSMILEGLVKVLGLRCCGMVLPSGGRIREGKEFGLLTNGVSGVAVVLRTPPSTGTLSRFLAVQFLRYQRNPYVDAVPQGTCPPAGNQIPYAIYALRVPKVPVAMHQSLY